MPPRPRTPRQPQDHKEPAKATAKKTPAGPKAPVKALAKGDFSFKDNGHVYYLPSAANYADKSDFSGGDFMDAVLNNDTNAEMKMAFQLLLAAREDITDEAFEALRAKPFIVFLEIVGDWMRESGVDAGK